MHPHRTDRRAAAAGLVGALLLSVLAVVPVAANTTAQTLPFAQDWSNTGLITTDNNWNGVPGVSGFLGANIAVTGADPQQVTVDGGALTVVANQTDPAGLGQGGVAEFELANPVVAIKGSSTADAPSIVISVNTTGLTNIHVAYNLRDIDGSANNAFQQVALQYRLASSGSFTNLPAGYVADATNGPSDATLVTPVSVTLPTAANNQPVVQLRVITTDAPGNDEWVGIDDISVTGVPPDTAPTVTTTTPSDGAVDVALDANLQVTFSEPVDVAGSWFDISCAGSGAHPATASGGPTTFTLDPTTDFAGSEDCTLTIVASQVTDQDTNDPPDAMASDVVVTFTTAAPPDEAPTVTSTTPADSAADVAVDSNVAVTFSEPVDVADGGFGLACDTSGAHPLAVTGGPTTFTLEPTTDFATGEGCSLTILASHVTDQDTNDPPNAMADDVIVSFNTVAPTDEAPTVAGTTPSDGDGDVQPNASLEVTFSEPVAVAGSWFSISCDTSGAHGAAVSGGPTTFILDPTVDLAENESCVVTIVAENVTDLDTADPPDAMAADFSYTFTTADLNAPPTVDAGGPYTVVEGGSVTVSATGTDPDGDALTYAWDLDGNGTFEKPGASFVFSAAGIQAPATRTFSVQVTDPDGATGTSTATISVVWAFDGFGSPLNGNGGINAANAGSTIPVKFSLGGNQGLAIFKAGYPASASYECGSTPPTEASEPAASSDSLNYVRGSDQYTFSWKTDKAWAGTCRVLILVLRDGTVHTAAVQFSKATELPVKNGSEAPGRTK
jgi:hypothetical protein